MAGRERDFYRKMSDCSKAQRLTRVMRSEHWMNHAHGNMGADVAHPVPVLIHLVKMLVLRQIRIVQVEWQWVRQLIGKLLKRRCPVRLGLVCVELCKRPPDTVIAKHATHGRNVKIIARGIALKRQHGLDPEHFLLGRNS